MLGQAEYYRHVPSFVRADGTPRFTRCARCNAQLEEGNWFATYHCGALWVTQQPRHYALAGCIHLEPLGPTTLAAHVERC